MLDEVKEELKICWDDEDSRLEKIIARGKSYLQGETGTELDFEAEGQPKALLLNYCRYAYNNALEYFTVNFADEILTLQLKEAVKVNASSD